MKQIGSVKDVNWSSTDSETQYVKGILPAVTVLGSQLLSIGGKAAQNRIKNIFVEACLKISVEQRFFEGLKSILR